MCVCVSMILFKYISLAYLHPIILYVFFSIFFIIFVAQGKGDFLS